MKEKEVKYRRHSQTPRGETPKYLDVKISVTNQQDKEELLKCSKYIHDFMVIAYSSRLGKKETYVLDSDIMGVNWLMHLYTSPELIEVKSPERFGGSNFEKQKNLL